MRRRAWFTLIAIFGVPILLFGAIEGVLYLCGVPRFVGTPEGNQISSFQDCRFGRSQLSLCDPVEVGTKKAILAYGESTVQGYPLKVEQRFTSVLQKRLDVQAPNQYQVLNYGVSCKDSFFHLECLRRSLVGHPAAVVFYAGHNDFTNNFNPKSLATPFRNSLWLPPVLLNLRSYSRLYSAMAGVALRLRGKALYPFKTREEYLARHQQVRETFLARLDEMRRLTEAAGARFILFTPGSNLRFRTENRGLRGQLFQDLKGQSWNLVAAGDKLLQEGKWRESLPLYREARDMDPVPSRATTAFNFGLRAYAHEHPEIRLVDFERELENRFGPVGIGCNLFGDANYCDQFHPNPSTHELIAELLLPQLP